MWPDRRLLDLFGIEHPILLAPMAGAMDVDARRGGARMAAVSARCRRRMLDATKLRDQVVAFRAAAPAQADQPELLLPHAAGAEQCARARLARGAQALITSSSGIDPNAPVPVSNRAPFDEAFCAVVEELKPEVVSFHFGLPEAALVARVKATGARSCRRRRRSPKRSGSTSTAATRSSRKASRPAAIAACS